MAASTSLAALLAGPPAPARVLGSTAAATYLAVPRPPFVLGVLASSAVRLPLGVVLPREVVLPPVEPAAGDVAAVVGDGVVVLRGHRLRPARWFDPSVRRALPRHPVLSPQRLRAASELLAREGAALPDPLPAAADRLARLPAVPAPAPLQDAVQDLLGRGPGLTPAGDDVLAGALVAAHAVGGAPGLAGCVRAALDARPDATPLLSAALLTAAAAGDGVPPLLGLLRALVADSEPHLLLPAVRAAVAVGHTSGTALAVGALGTLHHVLRTTEGAAA